MRKILYIDDEALTEKMKSIFDLMSDGGLDVIPLADLDKVMETLELHKSEVKLIVLDLIMPPPEKFTLEETDSGTTTGLKVLEQIRADYKDLPVVIVSYNRKQNVGEILKRFNVAEFIEKPVDTDQLCSVLNDIISRSHR